MRALIEWFDSRTGICSAMCRYGNCRVPGGVRLQHILPGLVLFLFVVQAITGFFLWTYYSPSTTTAWESVYHVQHHVPGGWLLRGIHHYAAQVLVALLMCTVFHLLYTGLYRKDREFVFWGAVVLGLVAMGSCLTGDILAWDQNSHGGTSVRVGFLRSLPIVGNDLYKLAIGGPAMGHRTLMQFFALHAGAIAAFFAVALGGWLWCIRRANDADLAEEPTPSVPYWPNQTVVNMAGCLIVLGIVLLLVGQHALLGRHEPGATPGSYLGAALGSPADLDPANAYAAARPEWSLRGLYELAHNIPGDIIPIFIIPGCIVTFLLAVPLIDKLHSQGHRLNLVVATVLLGGLVGLSALSYWHDAHGTEYLESVADGESRAHRVMELAQGKGIPVTGALSLLRTDAKTQGPVLYERNCASCHNYTDQNGRFHGDDNASAPDLTGLGSRPWIAGWFDKDKITGDAYFGKTAFADGTMVDFVDSRLDDVLDELTEEEDACETALEDFVAAMAAEAELTGPRTADADAKTVEGIAEDTLFLFEDLTCVDCHRFYHLGDLGGAPDLTGYMSRPWLEGIIKDPTHERFYGSSNDRMPAYHASPDGAALTQQQVDLLVDWLRGTWYEPAQP